MIQSFLSRQILNFNDFQSQSGASMISKENNYPIIACCFSLIFVQLVKWLGFVGHRNMCFTADLLFFNQKFSLKVHFKNHCYFHFQRTALSSWFSNWRTGYLAIVNTISANHQVSFVDQYLFLVNCNIKFIQLHLFQLAEAMLEDWSCDRKMNFWNKKFWI